MRFLNFPAQIVSITLWIAMVGTGCHSKTRVLKSPPHYNFAEVLTDKNDVFTTKLDLKLQKISGITWDAKNNVFLAINDEKGSLFFLNEDTKLITAEYTFGDKGNYEDVAIANGVPYILRSDGLIIKFIKDSLGKAYGVNVGKLDFSGTNDFETMYFDPGRRALVVLCKNCALDDAKSLSAFAFYPDSIGFDIKPIFTIDADNVEKLSPEKSPKFQPSAAAIHPVLKKLFILSSDSHQLVVTDLNGKVESVHVLYPKLFPQPEGIAFKTKGEMYISNEGVGTKATLLKFIYKDTSSKLEIAKAGYNFSVPSEKMELGKQLREISGMSYVPGKDLILAENDEKGEIFTVDFTNRKDNVGKITFGGKGDYEDIVRTDTAVYMLLSSGSIIEVMTKDSSLATHEFKLEKEGSNEYETLYLGPDGHSLIMLCKQCAHEKDKMRSAYRFDLATHQFSPGEVYHIDITDIQQQLHDDKALFKPSAAAISPVTGKLFVLASVGKLLVIAGNDGKVEQVYRLDPGLFNQPEGLMFTPNGDLYISNEGGEGIATILKFNYKK